MRHRAELLSGQSGTLQIQAGLGADKCIYKN